MTLFQDRKKAFEAKFVHDATLDFKTQALRNKLLGQWAAEKLHLSGKEAAKLARAYAANDVAAKSNCIIAKATADLNGSVSIDEIETKLRDLTQQARLAILDQKN